MPDLLTLTWAPDGEPTEDTLDLLDFVQGFTLADNGWIPQVAPLGQAAVTETLTFRAKATSHDGLAERLQILDDWIVKVDWSHDPTQRQYVWLNARWKTETETRRAPVYNLSYSLNSSPAGPFVRDDSFVPELVIVITRGPYWEQLTLTLLNNFGISTTGGADYLLDNGNPYIAIGDVPARIRLFGFNYAPAALRYVWVGFRSSRNGVLANFAPVWPLNGAVYSLPGDVTATADATAYNGNKMVIDFSGGASLLNRIRVITSDITANTADQRGLYTCLLRAKMSDGSIARARISSGFASATYSNPYYTNPRVPIQGTSWLLYDMGILRLPSIQRETAASTFVMAAAGAIIDAERVSGSGDLELDCLILIPYNDAYLNLDIGNNSVDATVLTSPDYSYAAYDSVTLQQSAIQPSNWNLPANNEAPLCVIAAQASTAHSLTPDAQISAFIIPRWRTLRGTE